MNEFKAVPHSGVGPVQLGMPRKEIREILGEPSAVDVACKQWGIEFPDKDCFCGNALQVSYDASLRAELIEVASSESEYTVTFDGVPVHTAPPDTVIAAVKKHGAPDVHDSEYPTNLLFRDLDLALYRDHAAVKFFTIIGIARRGYHAKD